MSNGKITIIIPVWNASKTLDRCVASVQNQTVSDWELILSDDGSLDNSLEICNRYAAKDSRIRVIANQHQGVSHTRNTALDLATGEYICFIDADDYVDADYLDALYRHREYDMVVCGYFVDWLNTNGSLVRQEKVVLPQLGRFDINDGCDCIYELFANGRIHVNWNKLFKRSIIEEHQIRYISVPINEDYDFSVEYLKHTRTVYATEAVTYHWQRLDGHQSGVNSMPENLLDIYLDAHKKTYSLFSEKTMVDRFSYYSYYYVILKYLDAYKNGMMCKADTFQKLNSIMSSPLVIDAFRTRTNVSNGEKIMNYLLKNRLFNSFLLLRRILNGLS